MLSAQTTVYDSLIQIGQDAYYEGEYDLAETIYLNGLEQVKNDATATLNNELDFKKLLGDVYRKKRDFPQSFRYYNEVIRRADGVNEDTYIWGKQNRSLIYEKQQHLVKSINENLALLPRIARFYGKDHLDYGNSLMNIGLNYEKMNDYLRAEEMLLEALEVFKVAAEPNSIEFNRIYNNLGIVYRSLGDYPQAIDYGEKALQVKLSNYAADHPSVSKYYYNLGHIYLDAGQAEKALIFLKKTLNLDRKNYGEQHYYTIDSKGAIGDALVQLKRYDEALTYYAAANDLPADDPDAMHPDITRLYLETGRVYEKMERYDEALEILKTTEAKLATAAYISPAMKVDLLLVKVGIFQAQGDLTQALDYTLDAVQLLSKQKVIGTQLPNHTEVTDYKQYIIVLEQLAELYTHLQQTKNSFVTLETAIKTIEWLRTTYHSNEARQYLHNETAGIFTKAVGTAYQLYEQTGDFDYLKKAFYLAEAGKANTLRNLVNEGLALRAAGIPTVLLDSLDDLRNRIGGLTEDLQEAQSESVTPMDIEQIKNPLFQLRTQHTELVRFFEKNYPAYYALKFGQQSTDLATLQAALAAQKTTLLSYFYDEKYVYCFRLTADKLTGNRQPHHGKLVASIKQFRDHLTPESALNATLDEQRHMQRLSLQLAAWLLPNLQDKQEQNLLIIPHGLLFYLPFELLTVQLHPSLDTGVYLIQKYPVYYSVSADFWVKEKEVTPPSSTTSFIGFAPLYNNQNNNLATRSNWSNLQWNVSEVEAIQQLLGGEIYTSTNATKDNFCKMASAAQVVHLAMHATVDDIQPQRSGLIFSSDDQQLGTQKLNLYEIYNLDLQAETVVINACNTGYGQLIAGEGVLSLAHAFNYAGAQNTLMNLWLADDAAASQIVVNFYKYWQSGQSKPAALRQAKMQYLQEADPLRSHPYFWAGLVLQGVRQPAVVTFPLSYLFMVIGLVGIVCFMWWR